jgi:peptide/nickel transport system permease protein
MTMVEAPAGTVVAVRSRPPGLWRPALRNRKVLMGLVLLGFFVFAAVAQPLFQATIWSDARAVYHPKTGFDVAIQHPSGPSMAHWLGTDSLGRDVVSMFTFAAGPTVLLGLVTAFVIGLVSLAAGAGAAYWRGAVDGAVTHVGDALVLLPPPLAIFILGAGRSLAPVVIGVIYGIMFGLGPATAAVRAAAFTVLAKPFVEAAHAAGGGARWILGRHVVPHLVPHVTVQMSIGVTGAIITYAFLQFFSGVGAETSFGAMVYSGITFQGLFAGQAPWGVLLAGALGISLLAAAFYSLGVGLREVFDPRLRAAGRR